MKRKQDIPTFDAEMYELYLELFPDESVRRKMMIDAKRALLFIKRDALYRHFNQDQQ
jgi:hypothetical protein